MKSKIKTQKSKMTIDKLAEMVQRGFLDQSERFDIKLNNFATKDDFKNLGDRMLTGFDKILGKLDKIHPHT